MDTWTVAPSLLQGSQADLCNWLSLWFSFKQFHKLTWNITFSGLSTMSCCYLKYLNDTFSRFTFCEEKNYSIWTENSSTPTRISHRYQFLSKRTFQSGRKYKVNKTFEILIHQKIFLAWVNRSPMHTSIQGTLFYITILFTCYE